MTIQCKNDVIKNWTEHKKKHPELQKQIEVWRIKKYGSRWESDYSKELMWRYKRGVPWNLSYVEARIYDKNNSKSWMKQKEEKRKKLIGQ